MYKVIEYNSIHNIGGNVIYDYRIVKVITSYAKAVSYAIKLKERTGKLYKVERV